MQAIAWPRSRTRVVSFGGYVGAANVSRTQLKRGSFIVSACYQSDKMSRDGMVNLDIQLRLGSFSSFNQLIATVAIELYKCRIEINTLKPKSVDLQVDFSAASSSLLSDL